MSFSPQCILIVVVFDVASAKVRVVINDALRDITQCQAVLCQQGGIDDDLVLFFFLITPLPPRSTLFPYTTLFRSDVLYHLLQVFELARDERPWDEEFLLAALLHDVGKGIDPHDHVAAALQVLDGLITPRTAWLIEIGRAHV